MIVNYIPRDGWLSGVKMKGSYWKCVVNNERWTKVLISPYQTPRGLFDAVPAFLALLLCSVVLVFHVASVRSVWREYLVTGGAVYANYTY